LAKRCYGTMKKIYYLSTCSTSARIMGDLKIRSKGFDLQDIKTEKITPEQLEEMKKLAGSYEALFSRIAMKYRQLGLNKKKLTEKEYRDYILDEYTFLKRPVIIVDNQIFIGSAKNNITAAAKAIG